MYYRGVQIRSESDPIGFVRISEQSDRIRSDFDRIRSDFGTKIFISDRTSIFEIKWITMPKNITIKADICLFDARACVIASNYDDGG
jgi:hypothetical protein